jgi:hypothetical protein
MKNVIYMSCRKSRVALFALVICVALAVGANANGPGKRGDYPQCQKVCVNSLERRMTEASEDYEKKGSKLLYQESVEKARSEYNDCIDRCTQPFPIK